MRKPVKTKEDPAGDDGASWVIGEITCAEFRKQVYQKSAPKSLTLTYPTQWYEVRSNADQQMKAEFAREARPNRAYGKKIDSARAEPEGATGRRSGPSAKVGSGCCGWARWS